MDKFYFGVITYSHPEPIFTGQWMWHCLKNIVCRMALV